MANVGSAKYGDCMVHGFRGDLVAEAIARDGIDIAVIYGPEFDMWYSGIDPEMQAAMTRAYNRWGEEMREQSGGRVLASGCIGSAGCHRRRAGCLTNERGEVLQPLLVEVAAFLVPVVFHLDHGFQGGDQIRGEPGHSCRREVDERAVGEVLIPHDIDHCPKVGAVAVLDLLGFGGVCLGGNPRGVGLGRTQV